MASTVWGHMMSLIFYTEVSKLISVDLLERRWSLGGQSSMAFRKPSSDLREILKDIETLINFETSV